MPAGTMISMTVAQSERPEATRGGIWFFRDGSSTDGTIRLEHGEMHMRIDVAWLTGRASVKN